MTQPTRSPPFPSEPQDVGAPELQRTPQRLDLRALQWILPTAESQESVYAIWVLGKVNGTAMVKTARVRATRLVLDPYLLKYFNKWKTYFAHDAHQQCSLGDTVLLGALPVTRSKHVKHELAEIIFKVGGVIDPITGKPCAGTAYLESPLSSETANPSKTPEELKVSST
ncbi:28S ribosomal protein S17, mitochondrial-like [Alexandromys fortis]|uniref:28S ribosomal protein S17, mitochondrial-like n=1 Tax=Alexandromys fortis TaxID=100897 RepID=UPI0021520299|nr:28S ribosomal protein S17, mitochondrial-like [Microtus fortis]